MMPDNPYTLLGEFAGLAKFMLKAERLFPDHVKLSARMRQDWKEQIARYDQYLAETVKKAEAVEAETLEVASCQPNS